MQLLYASMVRSEIDMLGSLLEAADIEFEVRNEFTHANVPGAAFSPELWVIYDADLAKAIEVREGWKAVQPSMPATWKCKACGESLEAQFTSCWKCGAPREGFTRN